MSIAKLHSAGFPLRSCKGEINHTVWDYCENLYKDITNSEVRVIVFIRPFYDKAVETALLTAGLFFLEKNFDVRYLVEIPQLETYDKIFIVPIYDSSWNKFISKVIVSGGFVFLYSSEKIEKPFYANMELVC